MGTLARGQRQPRRLPETAPSFAPRPRPAWPARGPAQPALSALLKRGALGKRERRPADPFPSWRLWLGLGGVHFSKNLLWGVAYWGAAGLERQFVKIKSWKGMPE